MLEVGGRGVHLGAGRGEDAADQRGVDGLELGERRIAAGEKETLDALVFQAIQQDGRGGSAVPSGAAGFLVVGFEGVGKFKVVDEADIGLIDTEPEGFGGDHDLVLAAHELPLNLLALASLHPAVVVAYGDAAFREVLKELVGGANAGGVDDAGPGLVFEHGSDARELGLVVDRGRDGEKEIVPLRTEIDERGIVGMERLQDLVDDFPGRGSGKSEHGWVAERLARFADVEECGAEVVTPLRDAVSLIHDQERDAAGCVEGCQKLRRLETLGRHVDQLGGVVLDVRGCVVRLAVGKSGVEFFYGDIGAGGLLLLILHEGDERRDHKDGFGQEEGGKLVGQGLSRSGRHDGKGVAAMEDAFEDLALAGPETLYPEAGARGFEDAGPGNGVRGCGGFRLTGGAGVRSGAGSGVGSGAETGIQGGFGTLGHTRRIVLCSGFGSSSLDAEGARSEDGGFGTVEKARLRRE